MKTPNGHEVIQLFEQFSPKKLAEQGDRIGLQIGSLTHKVNKVMSTLDVTEEVVDEAIEQGVNVIIAHHPPLFVKLGAILTDTPKGKIIQKLIMHNIAVYAAHTNLDVANGGVNDLLVEKLDLQDSKVLVPTVHQTMYKLQVYVPKTHAQDIREAIGQAGAGKQGEYDFTSFSIGGTGRFRPVGNASPTIGILDQHEEVEEEVVSTIVEEDKLSSVIKAMKKVHPYEDVAYDVWKLEQQGEVQGLGRVGRLSTSMTLEDFLQVVKVNLPVESVQVVGKRDTMVSKVAVLGGSGRSYFSYAKRAGADVYVTGDVDYHSAQYAEEMGLNVIDAGHYIESVMIEGLAKKMNELFKEEKWEVECIASTVNTNPFRVR